MSQSRRSTRTAAGAADAPPDRGWSSCPGCWGQRRIWEPQEALNREGTILVPRACEVCLGVGEVVR